ncbi:hypothetical protein R5R35_009951 [Gryllus longicercus]|uniref:Short-chain dehydrogenase/reductase 3 n=1 Tax=Gryllus longicercus TaxID=2509291 RepID=A0AAN9V594_9ORTH
MSRIQNAAVNGTGTDLDKMDQPGMQNSGLMVKVYSAAVLLLDVLVLLVRVMAALGESLFRLIVPPQEKSVVGEVVLITGAGHGIGRELAQQFADLGATIVSWDINAKSNEETVQGLRKQGFKAYAYTCDVSSREEVLRVAEQVKKEVGDVTILVNNAGIMPCKPLANHNPNEITRMFDINVFAHFWMLEAFLPAMLQNKHGHVVALSSMAGVMGIPNLVPYCASKFAVRGMMEALREELRLDARDPRVRFTCIYPFIVDTGLCHKPRNRFPGLLPIVKPKNAARMIITAMRRDQAEASLPGSLLPLNHIMRLIPLKAGNLIKDFIDSGVEAHDS